MPIDVPHFRFKHSCGRDAELEQCWATIARNAERLDDVLDRNKHVISLQPQAVCKEVVFYHPCFGLTFQREMDAFGFKPVIIVQSVSFASPAAGLIAPGDELLVVDGDSILCV